MKALIQRVSRASVSVDGDRVAAIRRGFLVLLGVTHADTTADAERLARKTLSLRVFEDEDGLMNRAINQVHGSLLVISQFTLYADTRKGNRPSFVNAAVPEQATQLYENYVAGLREELGDDRVATGIFGANMQVELTNDGPVTIELKSENGKPC